MTSVAMLLENNTYPLDVRVRMEAEALARAGYRVTVCAPRGPGEARHEVIDGVHVRRWRLPELPASALGYVLEYAVASAQLHVAALRELARGARALHLHNPPDTLFPAAAVARLLRRGVIFDHHDLAPELFAAKFGEGPVVRVLRALERWTMRVANVVVATNDSYRDVAIGRGRKAPEAVTVVRNGPPASHMSEPEAARGGSLSDPRLVFLGSMESQDGVDELPELLRRLTAEPGLEGVRLTLVGTGSRREPLELAFAELGLAERVRFTDQVPHDEVPALLQEADICLDPAPCTELNHHSTMIKIAEYMAAGRPIVAYPLRETERTAGDVPAFARCGDLASFAQRVRELAADGDDRSRRAALGRERVTGLSWERSEAALLDVYSSLLGRP
jgi:glycosyltransferase involved in cell wall biosynthesis